MSHLPTFQALTLRQQEVLGLRADGKKTKEIARLLGISTHTVEDHVKKAVLALGLSSAHMLKAWVWQQRGAR